MKKSEETKNKIIEAFLKAMSVQPWEKIGVTALCQEVGITRSTFYLYFSDIPDLMDQLQAALLADFDCMNHQVCQPAAMHFPDQFDYAPQPELLAWFAFCERHRSAIIALLDPVNGSKPFYTAMSEKLEDYLQAMMDRDGMPRDPLRSYFLHLCSELYILSARTWLTHPQEVFHSLDEAVHLVNAARVGSCYLSWKSRNDPDFDAKMKIGGMK